MARPALITVLLCTFSALAFLESYASADSAKTTIHLVSANGLEDKAGTINFHDTKNGLQIVTKLKNLPAGTHGFHIHANGSCDAAMKDGALVPAQAAGPHYDPANTGAHEGPSGHGHGGDLPALTVAQDGTASVTLYAPRLKAQEIINHAVVIHQNGDNYSDTPQPLGGGGARIACGLVKKD